MGESSLSGLKLTDWGTMATHIQLLSFCHPFRSNFQQIIQMYQSFQVVGVSLSVEGLLKRKPGKNRILTNLSTYQRIRSDRKYLTKAQ